MMQGAKGNIVRVFPRRTSATPDDPLAFITLLDLADAADFFAVHSGDYRDGDFYSGRWTT